MDITVVVPTYNRASTLVRCLVSVLSQTLKPRQIIVVDDGSEDETERVVETMNDPRLLYMRQRKSGANIARNLGIATARTAWIAFQDSDDMWLPDKLEKQCALLAETSAAACFCQVVEIDGPALRLFPRLRAKSHLVCRQSRNFSPILVSNVMSTQTLLVQREVALKLGGFDPELPRFQDWDFAIRLFSCEKVAYLAEPVVVAEKRGDSITKDFAAGIRARRAILRKYDALYKAHPVERARFLLDLYLRETVGTLRRLS